MRLDERVATLDADIALIAKTDPVAKRLQQLRGVGPLIATALIASVGTGEQYARGRQMAAALGLTPKQLEPASVKPVNVRVFTTRESNWELARE